MNQSDISHQLISDRDIQNNLVMIFPDSIILKNGFKIVSISKSITDALGFKEADLLDQSVHLLSDDRLFAKRLEKELSKGFFDNFTATLRGPKKRAISFKLSGFYLGLISDINGFAILKMKAADDPAGLKKQLDSSRNELDEFVYRTTHDLRGPLATILGLINLMKKETSMQEMKYMVDLLDVQARAQDDRLHNLTYLAESAQSRTLDDKLNCDDLESTLRSTLEENVAIDSIDFNFTTQSRIFEGINSRLTISILNHLLLYLINLDRGSEPSLEYSLGNVDQGIRIVIEADGFLCSYQLRQAIKRKDPLFTNIIVYPDLINFFAAQKVAQRISATVDIDAEETRQKLCVWVPNIRISA